MNEDRSSFKKIRTSAVTSMVARRRCSDGPDEPWRLKARPKQLAAKRSILCCHSLIQHLCGRTMRGRAPILEGFTVATARTSSLHSVFTCHSCYSFRFATVYRLPFVTVYRLLPFTVGYRLPFPTVYRCLPLAVRCLCNGPTRPGPARPGQPLTNKPAPIYRLQPFTVYRVLAISVRRS